MKYRKLINIRSRFFLHTDSYLRVVICNYVNSYDKFCDKSRGQCSVCALFFATFGRLGSHFRCRSAFKPIRQAKHGKEQLFILNLTHSQRTHFRSARHQMIFSAPERRKIDTLFSCKITKLQSIKSNRFRSENLRSLIIVKLKGFKVNHFRL